VDEGIKAQLQRLRLVVLDFDGVLTDNRVIVLQDGTEAVLCNRSDGLGITAVRNLGVEFLVLSKEQNPVVQARCAKLRLPCISGCDDKVTRLRAETERLGIALEDVAYLGNDINDIPCLRVVGLPVCVADAWPAARKHARFVTQRRGGEGAVREFCDLLVEARDPTDAAED
jgi:3-deoxy-D-manno-octulosonate 8-phosphate phosphatase (KDO 8-P phosphatase)